MVKWSKNEPIKPGTVMKLYRYESLFANNAIDCIYADGGRPCVSVLLIVS